MHPSPRDDDVAAIVGVVDIERQQTAEPPEVAPCGFHQPSRPAVPFEPVEIEDHLDRAVVALAQVHHPVGRVLGAADRTGQVRDITHARALVAACHSGAVDLGRRADRDDRQRPERPVREQPAQVGRA